MRTGIGASFAGDPTCFSTLGDDSPAAPPKRTTQSWVNLQTRRSSLILFHLSALGFSPPFSLFFSSSVSNVMCPPDSCIYLFSLYLSLFFFYLFLVFFLHFASSTTHRRDFYLSILSLLRGGPVVRAGEVSGFQFARPTGKTSRKTRFVSLAIVGTAKTIAGKTIVEKCRIIRSIKSFVSSRFIWTIV